MDKYNVVEIKEDITSRNNLFAKEIRKKLAEKKVFYLNVMASPGSGKTTLIVELLKRMKDDYKIGVIEADIDSSVDAETVSELGVRTLQMHTAGACHITCQMSYDALCALGYEDLDFVILENVGNLVCPAEFDTGATENLVLLSVPEGDDKPKKYPLMFRVADVVAVTKTDVAEVFDFDAETAKNNIKMRNEKATVFFLSAVKNDGVEELEKYLRTAIERVKNA
ncbi:MAG: hydrogenase nickel incorporation protein HypB [Clostridia bacterium]|nr:hydrogenase nickel incorporation protein HypB [Clostridia bacterium]